MIGGVAAAWAFSVMHWPLAVALLFGVLVAGLVGLLLDVLGLRPARKANKVTQIIITIGGAIVIRSAASLIWGTEESHLPKLAEGSTHIAGANVDYHNLLIPAAAAICMILLTLFYRRTSAGRAMRACAENPGAARLCGVSVGQMSAAAFSVSAILGGIGGVMVTPMLSMNFERGTQLGLKGFAASILGVLGNPVGGVVGGLLIGVLEQYSCWFSSMYKETLALVVVVVILVLRPRGLLSK
jgi:branched-chain amino acid transport system permease protein